MENSNIIGSVSIFYTVKGPPLVFGEIIDFAEGEDGSLKITRDLDIVRVSPGYLYYIFKAEDIDG